MAAEYLRKALYIIALTLMPVTLWAASWCSQLTAEAERGWWPALPVPGHSTAATNNANSYPSAQSHNE